MGISTGNSTDDTGPYSLFLLREEELRQAGVMAAHEGSALVSTAAATAFVTPSAAIPDDPILTPITDAATMALGIPTDPDTMAPGQTQWHLVGTWGLHADRVWPDYTGQGILVGVMDDGFQYTHWDISANYRTDIDRDIANNDNDAAPVYAGDNHGTSVIGTIIADDNGMGGVGVAFDARAYGIRLDFGGGGTLQNTYDGFTYAFTSGADVMNNSWGYTTAFSDTTGVNFAGLDFIEIAAALENLVDNGRGGLGTNIVFAAGNARVAAPGLAGGDNVNYHNMQNSPHTITVAAIDSDGTYSSFSTPGAALLVAAGGTTVYVPDRIGGAGYGGGDYTNFSGTSAAAPIVTGAIAVILDANPNLGWRDVQEILAYSTQHNDAASAGWQYNGASNWNGGGLHFSHDYGFGAVDLHRAVRLAETWIGTQTSANQTILAPVSASPAIAIPAIGTITHTINIAQDIEIEHVLIDLNISHARAGDLIVTLISPDGTESILIDRPVNGTFTGIYGFTGIDFLTTSNAHWGESSAGTWTLRIQDAAGGNAGTLNSWSLAFWGNAQSNDDVYIYTDDYGNFSGGALAARSTLTDTTGTDTINLAAVTSNTTLNMNGGMASTIAGDAMTIAGGTIIENAYLGDGNDTITGNSANNIIYGGRGNDNFFGSGGSDTLDGETGADTLTYLESIANFTFNFINATTLQITHAVGAAWTDLVRNIESFVFNEGTYTRAQLEAYVPGGGGGPNVINGTAGNDTLSGTAANNTINGGAGADTLSGMAGDDTLNGGDGADRLYAGAGNDMLHGGNGNDNYYYTASGEAEGDVIEDNGGTGDTQDRVYFNGLSSAFNPILRLESGNNIDLMVTSDWGTVRIRNQFAADASDRIEGIFGTVTGQSAATGIALTTAQLTFMGLNTDEILTMPEYGLSASQQHRIYGMGGNDTITGGANADYLYGGDGNDTVNGGAGNDYLYGDAGNDTINGDAGSDMIYGGLGADTISGGAGNDNYYYIAAGEAQGDIIEDNGGDATDRIYFSNLVLGTAPVYGISGVDLLVTTEWGTLTIRNQFAADASDRIEGIFTQRAGASTITGVTLSTMLFNFEGTSGSDTLTMPGFGISTSQSHRIYGRDGDDTIIGSTRGDYLYGDNGNDTLIGGGGADYLYGGSGADRFVFDALTAFPGQTRINDFSVAQGDIIDISDILTGYDPMSDLITDFIRITNSGGNSILAVDVNGGANSFVTLATIVGVTGLTDEQALVDSGNLVI